MMPVVTCRKSGYRASDVCPEVDTVWINENGMKTVLCPYHRLIHLDRTGTFRVDADWRTRVPNENGPLVRAFSGSGVVLLPNSCGLSPDASQARGL